MREFHIQSCIQRTHTISSDCLSSGFQSYFLNTTYFSRQLTIPVPSRENIFTTDSFTTSCSRIIDDSSSRHSYLSFAYEIRSTGTNTCCQNALDPWKDRKINSVNIFPNHMRQIYWFVSCDLQSYFSKRVKSLADGAIIALHTDMINVGARDTNFSTQVATQLVSDVLFPAAATSSTTRLQLMLTSKIMKAKPVIKAALMSIKKPRLRYKIYHSNGFRALISRSICLSFCSAYIVLCVRSLKLYMSCLLSVRKFQALKSNFEIAQ